MWVTGLPATLTIISVGQEYVRQGARVRPIPAEAFEETEGPKLENDPIERDSPPRVSQGESETGEASQQ